MIALKADVQADYRSRAGGVPLNLLGRNALARGSLLSEAAGDQAVSGTGSLECFATSCVVLGCQGSSLPERSVTPSGLAGLLRQRYVFSHNRIIVEKGWGFM